MSELLAGNYINQVSKKIKATKFNKLGDHLAVQQDYISTCGGDTDLDDEFFVNTPVGVKRVVCGDWIIESDEVVIDVIPPTRFRLTYSAC